MRLAAVLFSVLAVAVSAPATVSADPITVPTELLSTEDSFHTGDGEMLGCTTFVPRDSTGKLPGLVLVHGSGTGLRANRQRELEAFARKGIATMVCEKRTVGYSRANVDFGRLADDVLRMVTLLMSRPDVDPAKVGVWGLSEGGGWTVPLAASRSKDIAYVISVGGSGVDPLRQQSWANSASVARAGVRGPLAERFPHTLQRTIFTVGGPNVPYDGIPALTRVSQPVLALWGDEDRSSPPAESAEAFRSALALGGNQSVTIKFFPGAGHRLHTVNIDPQSPLVSGYADLVGSWVKQVTGGHPPAASVDPLPVQLQRSVDAGPPAWWEAWPLQLAVFGFMLISFVGYIVSFRWKRGSRELSWLALAGSGMVLGFVAFLIHFATDLTGSAQQLTTGPLIAGRPIEWLVLQALAILTAAATGVLLVRWRTVVAASRTWAYLLTAAGVISIPWAVHWTLLLP